MADLNDITDKNDTLRTKVEIKGNMGRGCWIKYNENCDTLLSFWKPYEITSWNEQGEITQIEGMWIITFCVISSCSHRECWKQLYLIMPIHYLIRMSTIGGKHPRYDPYKNRPIKPVFRYNSPEIEFLKKENAELRDVLDKANKRIEELESKLRLFDPRLLEDKTISSNDYRNTYIKSIELKNEKIEELEKKINKMSELDDKIDQLTDRVSELEATINKKDKEITTFEKHNALMSELLDERKSGWVIRRDLAIRTNPVPDEPNEFGYPLDFNEENVYNLHSNEEKSTWCHFKYYPKGDYPDGKFEERDMPWSLYEFLSGRLKENDSETALKIKKEKTSVTLPQSLLVIKDKHEFIKHLESHDIYPDSITKLNDVYKFLDENRERTFSRKRFSQICNISPKTVTIYLNYLIKCHMVFQIPGSTKYKVNIKEK